jgi:hypothetical protein
VTRRHRAALLALLGLVTFAPLLPRATTSSMLPEWLGAAIALAAAMGQRLAPH